jgi:DNA-binding transcriptional regulator YdaS (Cro superfamily)
MSKKVNLEALEKAIQIAGGVNGLAKKINVCYQTVLNWKNGRVSMSIEKCKKIEKAIEGAVKAKDILPDYPWDELR